MERIEIFTSKKKNVFLLFLVIIFLAVGIFCFLNANELSNDGKRSIIFIEVISIIVMVFALTALFFIIKNLLNNQWVLAIDEKNLHIRIQKYYLISPISIASSTMKISHKELFSLLLVSFATYKDKN